MTKLLEGAIAEDLELPEETQNMAAYVTRTPA
jgi:hypothetical protein